MESECGWEFQTLTSKGKFRLIDSFASSLGVYWHIIENEYFPKIWAPLDSSRPCPAKFVGCGILSFWVFWPFSTDIAAKALSEGSLRRLFRPSVIRLLASHRILLAIITVSEVTSWHQLFILYNRYLCFFQAARSRLNLGQLLILGRHNNDL